MTPLEREHLKKLRRKLDECRAEIVHQRRMLRLIGRIARQAVEEITKRTQGK